MRDMMVFGPQPTPAFSLFHAPVEYIPSNVWMTVTNMLRTTRELPVQINFELKILIQESLLL
jgi:hypothetical protein